MTSYKAEVIADSSNKFAGNMLRFASQREAQLYVRDLSCRWTLVRDTRVVESDEPVNARIEMVDEWSFKVIHLEDVIGTAP